MEIIYFGNRYSYLVPHVGRYYYNSLYFHSKHWDYPINHTTLILNDFEDDGHGGAIVMPVNLIILGIAPFNYTYSIVPSNERFQWLLSHEFTHVVLTDKANKTDRFWRKIMLGKILRNERQPVSALWSYLTTPRWYAPRWFHEGIACYMETWTSGGVGRSLSPYDEMYFRSIVNENYPLYSVVGLETEGTTVDFQVGANSYLYGARFVTYLSRTYGEEKLKQLYSRTDDSKAFYASQFKKVYSKSVNKAWKEWREFEQDFQKSNIQLVKEYPITDFREITNKPLGSVSNFAYDKEDNKIFAAVNYPGAISQIAEIDLYSGKIRKIATLDAPLLYSVAYIAYDSETKDIFFTEQNAKYRSLVKVNAKTRKKTTLIKLSRTGNITFNSKDKSLWGIKSDNGYATIVKIPYPYNEIVPIFTADFGKSVFDIAVSNDGKLLSATQTGIKGDQSVILFDIEKLEIGEKKYEILHHAEDYTLNQFRFSDDDKYLIGSSYYTGVSNIWRLSIEDKDFELMSNTETGYFNPIEISQDSLLVLKFLRNGMQPGIIPKQILTEANAINFLGNQAIQKNPELDNYAFSSASKINIDSLKIDESKYSSLKKIRFSNAFPDITGYKETVALGYRLNWSDNIGLASINAFLATSPWSSYEDKQKIHGLLDMRYYYWTFKATYNNTDFYDLFGPTKRSRAGYSLRLSYNYEYSLKKPFKYYYGFNISHYGDLEVLPQFQNIASPIKDLQYVGVEFGVNKLRKTLGAVDYERGYKWDIYASSSLANNDFYHSIVSEQHVGINLPYLRNTSFWIRNSIGQSIGAKSSSLSYFYFGGFRNNYVDWQDPAQYRKNIAFPGAQIDEIKAYNYIKTMAELNLKPIRLRNVGTTWLYPTFIKTSLFGTHLIANPNDNNNIDNYFNIGAQIDIELVLFSYLKTTWSVGYAQKIEANIPNTQQWMFSVKLLGR